MPQFEDMTILNGNANPRLAQAIASKLKVPLGRLQLIEFSNENIFAKIDESVRENDVFIVQPLSTPVNRSIMELLIIIDAAKRASAGRITAVIPYYAYGRTDKKDQPRVPITARLLADMITVAGANRVLTIDLHAGQIQGFFNIPVDELTAMYLIADHFQAKRIPDRVVVSTDIGNAKRARNFAELIDAPLAIVEKRRTGNADRTEVLNLIGEVEGKTAILVDDEIDTGGSMVQAVNVVVEHGAKEVYASCVHPVLSSNAVERLRDSPIRELITTDTIPIPPEKRLPNITILSVAPMLAETIWRIHSGRSVGAMFEANKQGILDNN
ncbi:MAG TPA: ribose-phosphate pyrophosphokinase [Chloroflexia bacterium]|nr:ribose-phosphate pyrophosphokinase [Chloroflexia bacterium]